MNNEPANKLPSTLTEDDVLTWIEARVDQLHVETRILVDDYWRRLKAEQKNHAASEKARIGVRVRKREACLSFSIEWFRMAIIRENGRIKPIARYVKKGSGYHYPLARLLQGEPEWEADLVEELETEFADIRKQNALLGKIRDAVQSYRKATQSGFDLPITKILDSN
ncbi:MULTISPECIES: conjugative transfer protein MobI(A/C) [Methylobacter]|uniref:conjugative transfer protein MobI(A/C) n=1 Tax=Methylobacter TaxID=429 RepID=UPI001FAD72B4|nr:MULTISPECIES: conjugative transfer protein MobI(A/C) [Methylobacter]UOA07409.1 hypothetical protein KKZ03_14150 [Methylobacter sp. S3L5C]